MNNPTSNFIEIRLNLVGLDADNNYTFIKYHFPEAKFRVEII